MSEQRGKTIKQIADELGVSKQTVYKRYKGKLHTVVAPYVYTEQGALYVLEQGENLIKSDFLEDDHSNGAHTERSIGAPEDHVLYAILKEELAAKNKQIEQLQANLAEQIQINKELAQSINAERKNELAGTIREMLPDGVQEAAAAEPAIEVVEQKEDKPSFFNRVKYIFTGK